MDPYNFNVYGQPQGPQIRMPGQGMPPGGIPGQGMMPGGPSGPIQGGPNAPMAPQGTGGIQAGLQQGPAPQMPPPGGPPGDGELSPEMIQQMIALRSGGTALRSADKQQLLADQLRADARGALEAKRVPSSTGGMVIGPTWGSALGSLANDYRAMKLDEGAAKSRADVDSERAAASEALFNAMKKRGVSGG